MLGLIIIKMKITPHPVWKYYNAALLYFSTVLVISCSDDESQTPIVIDPQVQDLVDLFIQEAETRNVELDLSGLRVEFKGELETSDGNAICGRATSTSPNALIEMSQTCWDGFDNREKEIIMFHELGHALLFRPHLDTEFESGHKISLMHSNPFDVYAEWTLDRKDYYLDELFGAHDGSTPIWAHAKTNERVIYESDFDEIGDWTIRSFASETPEEYISFGVDSTQFTSPPSSLYISSSNIDAETSHYWRLELNNPNIDPNSQLELTARIRGENLEGQGITISIRGDDSDGDRGIFFRGEPIVDQSDFDFQNVRLTVEPYTPVVDKVLIFFVILSETSGTAYLDELRLIERY